MSVAAARTTSTIAEKTTRLLLSPFLSSSSNASSSTTSLIKASSCDNNNNNSLWLWTAFGLGMVSLRLCKDAIEFYRFCTAWNEWWMINRKKKRKNRSMKEVLDNRRIEIHEALTTMKYGELKRRIITQSSSRQVPKNKYKSRNNISLLSSLDEQKSCAVCLLDFQDGDTIGCSKNFWDDNASCRHIFHKECLQAWLTKHTTCPMCRQTMVSDPDSMLSGYRAIT